ncbi:MAG: hypothetical protein ACLQDY_29885 [Streptosporangiaceae bacterium]
MLAHDARQALGSIQAPALITFEHCAHAPIYEDVDQFNQQTLAFLQRQSQ